MQSTDKGAQAEEELERAWRARVGVSAHKLFRIGSCHALAHLAQGNYAASAKKSMEQLERLENEAKAALASGGMRAAASAAAPEGMVQQLMRMILNAIKLLRRRPRPRPSPRPLLLGHEPKVLLNLMPSQQLQRQVLLA